MKKIYSTLLITSLIFFQAIGQNTYDEVYNILQTKCASCHSGSNPSGQLDFSGTSNFVYSNIFETNPVNPTALSKGDKLIDAGSPETSYLLRKIAGSWDQYYSLETAEGGLMPPYGSTQLTMEEMELIRQWILHGAPITGEVVNTQLINDFYSGMGLPKINPPAKPNINEGFQIRFGPIILGPNEEVEYRLLKKLNLGNDIEVNRLDLEMNDESHHFILYENESNNIDDGLRLVSNFVDILDGKFLQAWQDDFDIVFPTGTAFGWDSNIELDLNYHCRNYNSDSILLAEAYVNVYTQPSGTADKLMQATLNTYNPIGLLIPPNQTSTFEGYDINELGSQFYDELNPTQAEPLYIYMLTSHTHKLGVDYDIFKRELDSSTGAQVFEGFYNYDYTFNQGYYDWEHPPVRYYDPPLEILPGEGLIHKAEYNNYTNNLVTFGLTTNDEMMIYYCHFTVGSPVNVNEKNLADLIVYPNPATNNFKITSEEKISQIQLYNALGKLVYNNNNLNDFTHIVSLANNPPKGLYFVKVKSSSGIQTKKIIVQ